MTFFQWRRFNFFELVKDADGGNLSQSFKDVTITCCSSGRGHIVFGDNLGLIHFLDRQYHRESFKAFAIQTTFVTHLKQSAFLAAVGEDEPASIPIIKIWNLEKKDVHNNPLCVHNIRASPSQKPVPLTAFAVDEQMHLMAAGFADGSVVLYRGDLSRDRHCKQKVLQHGTGLITGLSLRTFQKISYLFVATTSSVLSYTISSRDKEQQITLDCIGCSSGCTVLADSKQAQHFMIARNDAVYCYTVEGRGPCYAFEGEKILLHWFRGYLVVVSKANNKGDVNDDRIMVTIFDVHNKFIAFTGPIPKVHHVISEWGSLLVLTKDKKVFQLVEKDLHSKLDILFKKNLYDVAVRVAKGQQYDVEGLVEIFRQYGDHLYAKGNHSGAMEQYLKTIGRLEPSYVIKRFLDAQRIHQLTAYLQELHKQGLANEDHTTLLLNCYTKLRDTERLNEFLNAKDQKGDFDVETAIRVCRQAGYFEQALRLAKDREKHDLYLKILLDDTCDYLQALEYISKLDMSLVKDVLKEYGSVLLENIPDQTTELLLKFCSKGQDLFNPEELLLLFVNNNKKLVGFLERILQVTRDASSVLYFALLEQYLMQWSKMISDLELEKKILQLLQQPCFLSSVDRVLFLCQTHKFRPGVLLVFEKTKLYHEILQFYAGEDDFDNVITTCRRFGQQEPSLWVQALVLTTASDKVTNACLSEILTVIEKMKLLPPLRVVELLCRSPPATLGLARDYLIRTLQADQASISEDERLIQKYRQETATVRDKIHEIKTKALVFQGSKCGVCSQPLELPSVHFLCLHSFHQHCFDSYSESDHECPACHGENKRILEIVQAQEQSKELHEAFHGQLEKAEDPFTVLSDYFGRGVFNTFPPWQLAISKSVTKKDSLPSWNLPDVGPGGLAKLHLSEGKTNLNTAGITNEGRLRTQEIGARSVPDISEARLRQGESMSATEKVVTTAAKATISEARHRLQEGNKSGFSPSTTITIPQKPVTHHFPTTATSVPNAGMKKLLSVEMAKSLSRPASSGVLRSSVESIRRSSSAQGHLQESDNPFGAEEYDETKNPFAEGKEPINPFGEEDEYNDSMNPFADD